MFYTECERLANRYPDLASVFQQLDAQLQTVGTGAVLRLEDLATFFAIRLNQARSALDLLAAEGLLRRVEMIECRYCEMAVDLADYMDAIDEDDEYRCTSCDRVHRGGAAGKIVAYVPGEMWSAPLDRKVLDGREELATPAAEVATLSTPLDYDAWYTHDRIAKALGLDRELLRKRLDRFRRSNLDAWKENEDRRPREPKYLYRPGRIVDILNDLYASSERPTK